MTRPTPARNVLQKGTDMEAMGSLSLLLVTLTVTTGVAIASGRLVLGGVLRLMERHAVPAQSGPAAGAAA